MNMAPLQTQAVSPTATAETVPKPAAKDDTSVRFEQLLWAELLTHTGLEDALTLGGGQGASMFSRYFVEAIAADLAEQHPLGLLDKTVASAEPVKPSVELKA